MIDNPLPDGDAWVLTFSAIDAPILRRTALELEGYRQAADRLTNRTLSAAILQDPLMVLKLLTYHTKHRSKTQQTDVTTVERSLLMIGIEPFFRNFQNIAFVEEQLKDHPKALLGLLKVIARSRKAAHWAREWAVLRHDIEADEIALAALLHDFAEMLMWCFAPRLALMADDLKCRNPQLRSTAAQIEVFGITLLELQQDLVHRWNLPQLISMLMDDTNSDNPRVRNVRLAVDLARHTSHGWTDAAIPDDLRSIMALLHLDHVMLANRLGLEPTMTETLLAKNQVP